MRKRKDDIPISPIWLSPRKVRWLPTKTTHQVGYWDESQADRIIANLLERDKARNTEYYYYFKSLLSAYDMK